MHEIRTSKVTRTCECCQGDIPAGSVYRRETTGQKGSYGIRITHLEGCCVPPAPPPSLMGRIKRALLGA